MDKQTTQLRRIVEAFRENYRCDAHEMLVRHGITRTATYIWRLRRHHGWNITTHREPGEMAEYHLLTEPDWEEPFRFKPRATASWSCPEGHTDIDAATFVQRTPSWGRGYCGQCGRFVMWRR